MVMAGAAAKQLGNTSGPIICCMRGRVCRGSQWRVVLAELLQQFLPRTSAAVQDSQGITSDCGRQVWCTCVCLMRTYALHRLAEGTRKAVEGWGLKLLCKESRWNSNSLTVIETPQASLQKFWATDE